MSGGYQWIEHLRRDDAGSEGLRNVQPKVLWTYGLRGDKAFRNGSLWIAMLPEKG